MKYLILSIIFSLSIHSTHAHKKHSHEHSHSHRHQHGSLGAHVHGEVELAIVSAGKQIAIELKSPGESLIGFEHEPKTQEEKNKLKAIQDSWNQDAFGAFHFASDSNKCHLAQASLIPEYDGGHSVFHGEALYECELEMKDQQMIITLKDKFSSIKKLMIEALPEGKAPIKHTLDGESKSYTLNF
jgi:hypothetical protein